MRTVLGWIAGSYLIRMYASSMGRLRGKASAVVLLTSVVMFVFVVCCSIFPILDNDLIRIGIAAIQNRRHCAHTHVINDVREATDDIRRTKTDTTDDIAVCDNTVRLRHLARTCDDLELTDAPIPWQNLVGLHWIVDDVHGLFYCLIPKVATHTIRHLLATPILGQLNDSVLYPMENYLSATGFRLLQQLDEAERSRVLDNYFKMIIVRHPLDRLRSAYANKMKKAGLLNWQVLYQNRKTIEDYLRRKGKLGESAEFDPIKMTIDFDEFIELIALHEGDFLDEHWMTFYNTCYPCSIRYDAVMRIETLQDDVTLLYRHLASGDGSVVPKVSRQNADRNIKPSNRLSVVRDVFKTLPTRTLGRILRIYDRDFRMFGYHWDSLEGATCHISLENQTNGCC